MNFVFWKRTYQWCILGRWLRPTTEYNLKLQYNAPGSERVEMIHRAHQKSYMQQWYGETITRVHRIFGLGLDPIYKRDQNLELCVLPSTEPGVSFHPIGLLSHM